MSKLLINEPPLQVLPTLAQVIGLNEAIVLQQIHYYSLRSRDDGWVIQPVTEWVDASKNGDFKFWSKDTLERTLKKLRAEELIETDVVAVPGGKGGVRRQARMRVNFAALEALELKLSRSPQSAATSEPQPAATLSRNLRQPPTDLRERDLRDTPLSPPRGGRGRRGASSKGSRGPSTSWFGSRSDPLPPDVVEACPQVVAIDAAQMWATACELLRSQVAEDTFDVWLAPLHAHSIEDGVLVVGCPIDVAGWVGQRFGELIAKALGGKLRLYACSGPVVVDGEPEVVFASVEDAETEARSA